MFLTIGIISFGIGSIGAILPILPTTPFLLLAGYCFSKSSKRFTTWLHQTKLYQFYVADYVETKSIPRKKKRHIFLNICILMGISILIAPLLWVKGLLFGLLIFLTIMLFKIIPDK